MKKLDFYLLFIFCHLTIQIGQTQSYPPADDCLGGPIYPSLASLLGTLSPTSYSNPNGPNPFVRVMGFQSIPDGTPSSPMVGRLTLS
ncbi:MAG: hypothetical protein IPI90_12485 [Saprospiraceae bacterium]|nr:hypothetical protein [Candidatus Vicinibacter affinis]